MSRISGKINLLNLFGVVKMIKGQAGEVECLVIPIEKNKLFKGTKGIYLDLIAFEINEPKEGSKDTHLVKQSFSKEEREKMTEEQLKALPLLGSLQVWGERTEQEPVSSPATLGSNDDLPF
jgi:hypothetical protein